MYSCCCILHINRSGLNHIPSNIRGCQSGTWSQRGTKVNGSHDIMVTTRYSDQQRFKSRQNLMRLYKRWHRPITKRFIKPPLLHIESSLDRLGLLSPTHDQRSQQQIGEIRIRAYFNVLVESVHKICRQNLSKIKLCDWPNNLDATSWQVLNTTESVGWADSN